MIDIPLRGATPRDRGYSMPAEWAPHRATWLSWPHNLETWPSQLEKVRKIWLEMIRALSPHEQVCLLVNDQRTADEVRGKIKESGGVIENVKGLQIPTG